MKKYVLGILLVCMAAYGAQRIGDSGIAVDGTVFSNTNPAGSMTLDPGSGGLILNDLTANTVPYLDASKVLTSSAVTDTVLGYLDLTSSGQTQLDAKIDDFSGTTDNVILRTDGAGGDAVQETGITINDTDEIANVSNITAGLSTAEPVVINGSTFDSTVEVHAEGATDLAEVAIHRHSDTSALGSHIIGVRSKGTEAAETIVVDGNNILRVVGVGFDGTDYAELAEIDFSVDGTPGNNDMPGRLSFKVTADGASTTTERMRLSNDGSLNMLTEGEFRYQDAAGGEYMGFKSPTTLAGSTTFTLPDGDGGSGETMVTDGAGTLSWDISGANTTLSNLTSPTSVNQSLLAGGGQNLGSFAAPWGGLFLDSGGDIQLQDAGGNSLMLDGSYTGGSGFTDANDAGIYTANGNDLLIMAADIGGSGNSGDIAIETEDDTDANSGSIQIKTGDTSSTDSGSLVLRIGTATGTQGKISFVDGSEGVAAHVWTSQDTGGGGGWAALPATGVTVESKTSSFTAVTNYHYIVDTSLVDVTATLPTSVGESGKSISFVLIDGTNDLIIDGATTETINDLTTLELREDDESATIISDNADWDVTSLILHEYVEAEVSSSNYTVSANTWVDATGATVSLEPGTWRVCYEGNAYYEWVSGAIGVSCDTALRDGSNNIINGTQRTLSDTLATGNTYHVETVSACAEVTITSDTSYKASILCAVADTAAKAAFLTGTWTGSVVSEGKTSARRMK